MVNDREYPDDVSAMMEALWGPRSGERASLSTAGPSEPSAQGADHVPQHVVPVIAQEPVLPDHDQDAVRRQLEALGSELRRLSVAVDESQAKLRDDLHAEMVEQFRLVLAEALKQGDARAVEFGTEVERRQEALVYKDLLGALRMDFKDAVSRFMSGAEAELRRRVALMDAALADTNAQVVRRLDEMAALVTTEAARAAEQACARAGMVVAPLQSDLRALQEQTEQIGAVVADLQRRLPAS